jgi:hypothetical protein
MTPLRWITDQRIYEARRLKPSGDFGGYAASASRVGSPTSCSLSGRIQLDSVPLSACAVAVYIAAGFLADLANWPSAGQIDERLANRYENLQKGVGSHGE